MIPEMIRYSVMKVTTNWEEVKVTNALDGQDGNDNLNGLEGKDRLNRVVTTSGDISARTVRYFFVLNLRY